MSALLAALPTILQLIPALFHVISSAMSGDTAPDEGAWCAHVLGLEDVCAALRNQDETALAAVSAILTDIGTDKDPLNVAIAALAARKFPSK